MVYSFNLGITMNRLRQLLIKHEGLRLKPYKCTAGKISVGVGRNLEDVGISEEEAYLLLGNDIVRVLKEATESFPWFKFISLVRQDVVVSMIFNLGLERFKGFKKMIDALQSQNYERAAEEMCDSLWAKQVGLRAQELTAMMRSGRYVE